MNSILKKFKNAFNGILIAIRDTSILIQVILAIVVVIFGFFYGFNLTEWCAIVLVIGGVIVTESINSCIEMICDMIDMKQNNKIKKIKDLSSFAVLLMCIVAVIVGVLILKGAFR